MKGKAAYRLHQKASKYLNKLCNQKIRFGTVSNANPLSSSHVQGKSRGVHFCRFKIHLNFFVMFKRVSSMLGLVIFNQVLLDPSPISINY